MAARGWGCYANGIQNRNHRMPPSSNPTTSGSPRTDVSKDSISSYFIVGMPRYSSQAPMDQYVGVLQDCILRRLSRRLREVEAVSHPFAVAISLCSPSCAATYFPTDAAPAVDMKRNGPCARHNGIRIRRDRHRLWRILGLPARRGHKSLPSHGIHDCRTSSH